MQASDLEIRRALRLLHKQNRRKERLAKVGKCVLCSAVMLSTGFLSSLCSVMILENPRGRLVIEMAVVFFAVLAVGRIFFEKRAGGR